MTKYIRIYGERNSGTNFVSQLLISNFPVQVVNNVYKENGDYTNVYDCKHETPVPKQEETIVDILIVRKLVPWLYSFFKTQWHLQYQQPFQIFLSNPLQVSNSMSSQLNERTNQKTDCGTNFVNYRDQNLSIFELRYLKWKEMYDYFDSNKNVVLLQVDRIQKDMYECELFLKKLNQMYDFMPMEHFQFKPITTYKSGKRQYIPSLKEKKLKREEKQIIADKIDKLLENQIDQLHYVLK